MGIIQLNVIPNCFFINKNLSFFEVKNYPIEIQSNNSNGYLPSNKEKKLILLNSKSLLFVLPKSLKFKGIKK